MRERHLAKTPVTERTCTPAGFVLHPSGLTNNKTSSQALHYILPLHPPIRCTAAGLLGQLGGNLGSREFV